MAPQEPIDEIIDSNYAELRAMCVITQTMRNCA
jgi:hypothetical protein